MNRSAVITLLHPLWGWLCRRAGSESRCVALARQSARAWWAAQSFEQARCDLCGRGLARGEGYLFEGGSAQQRWSICPADGEEAGLWLVCEGCVGRAVSVHR